MNGETEAIASTQRPRVLVLASTFPRWPDDTEPPFVYNLSRQLAERFEVFVLAPHAAGSRRAETMDGMAVHRFRYAWPAKYEQLAYGGMLPNLKRKPWLWAQVPFFLIAELISTLRLARSHDVDVIHAHWLVPQGLVAALAATILRKPVVVTAHGADVHGLRGRVASALKRWALGRMTRVTAVSQGLADSIQRLSSEHPVDVISMGVDVDRFRSMRGGSRLKRSLNLDGPMILFVGRLAEKKGVRYMIDAMPGVLRAAPAAAFVIVGDGPLRLELERRADTLGIAESVRFMGAKRPDELPEFYSAADVFVGPSIVARGGDAEGVPVSLMEAMACGTPVVTTDVGGIGELVTHDRTGLVVKERDPAGLAESVSRILTDEVLSRRLRRNARSLVQRKFAQSVIANRYEHVLLEAAA